MSDFWYSRDTWYQSAHNTKWCLIGCALGDFGTILFFQLISHNWTTLAVFLLAMINGLLTSITLETIILILGNFTFRSALKTALGMSIFSMLAMEIAMNSVDWLLVGEARLVWWVVPIALFAGFLAPWPYNYWRLKKHGHSCH